MSEIPLFETLAQLIRSIVFGFFFMAFCVACAWESWKMAREFAAKSYDPSLIFCALLDELGEPEDRP